MLTWEDVVDEMTWMPNTKLGVVQEYPGHKELRVRLITSDTYSSQQVRIGHRFELPAHIEQAGRQRMIAYIRTCLHRVVIHEADEWLLVSGVRLFDPHNQESSLNSFTSSR